MTTSPGISVINLQIKMQQRCENDMDTLVLTYPWHCLSNTSLSWHLSYKRKPCTDSDHLF